MTEPNFKTVLQFFLAVFIALPSMAAAQENDGKEGKNGERKPRTIAELTRDSDRHDGFFTLFRDRKSGEAHMLIRARQLNTEFIYWTQVNNGVAQAGYLKGDYGPSRMVSVRRHFNRIEFIAQNNSYYFDPESALSKAADTNISSALLAVAAIIAEDKETGDILIKANRLFKSESLAQITPSPDPDKDPKKSFSLGKLDAEKTKIVNLRSYPRNTDVEVEYVFSNPTPRVRGGAEITDSRNISLRVMHSFIEAPENDYQPRSDDARVGFFGLQVTDLTSLEAAPYRDVINRWHLVRKDPDAELSEPVEPITWWIENTTPHEWRDLIRDAALEWNSAFEKAGFKNALVVKIQPDDADWDAGDIRYNVLRWTSSPDPQFGGSGPSLPDPRTGQLIGADIRFEFSFMSRFTRARGLIQDDPDTSFGSEGMTAAMPYCTLGHSLQLNASFVRTAADVAGIGDDSELAEQLVHDTMHFLVVHELGHTLGLSHNMKATNFLTPEEAFDSGAVERKGLSGSIMDYPAVNFAAEPERQTRFYPVRPGPYDEWLIEYAYSPALGDPEAEKARLEAILARSTEPGLAFGNDADAMRTPGKGLDPRVNTYDMSTDAVRYASDAMTMIKETLEGMAGKYPDAGKSYQETRDGISVMMIQWSRSAAVVSRYVGGVYVDRAVVGQPGASQPFTPVEAAKQRQAMDVLARQVFAPAAFELPGELLARAAHQRRGWDHADETEDPKVHDAVLGIQKAVLDHLLHPVVMKRITDTALYGNEYSLSEMMGDLTDAIFKTDARGNVNSQRQNLQMEYVRRLVRMIRNGYDTPSQSMAVYTLNAISDLLDQRRGANVSTQAHAQNLRLRIERALDTGQG